MKKMLIALCVVAFAGSAVAADKVVYPAKAYKDGKAPVTFDHKKHAEKAKCADCHTTKPEAKIAVAKEYAHDKCKSCHSAKSIPTSCGSCHK